MAYPPRKRRRNPPLRREGSSGFDEGLNTLAHPSMLKNSELAEFINGIYSQYGTITKRLGSTIIGQPAENATKILTLKSVYGVGGVDRHFRISDNGKPEIYSFANRSWSYFSGTVPAGYSGSSPSFDSNGVPTFTGNYKTHIVQLSGKIFFLNQVDQMCYWENGQWFVYKELTNPSTRPTVAKTGSATGSTTWFYYYVYYSDVGGTLASPTSDPSVQSNGQGYFSGMPITLDNDTFLTVTIPTPPAGTTRVGIYRSNLQGIGFYLADIEPTQTTYVDKGVDNEDTFFGLPTSNDTGGQHFKLVDVFQDKLIGVTVEGGDEYLYWTGEPYTSPSGSPSFSVPYGGGYIPYRLGDGTKIRGIHAFVSSNESSLLVFKDSAFGRFQFNELGGQIQDINIAIGSLSPESLHIAGNNFRFWGREGASSVGHEANYGNLLRYSVLSLRADAISQQVTANSLPQVCAEYHKNLSLFGISTQVEGGNNSMLVYDERYNAWALWTGLHTQTMAKMISSVDNVERLYFGANNQPNVVEMFSGRTDGGTTGTNGEKITFSATTKQYDMNLSDQFKRFDRVTFVFGSLVGNSTTIGTTYADQKGVHVSDRLLVDMPVESIGFGSQSWGTFSFGQPESEAQSQNNSIVRFINLRQRDMYWVKFNIQNDGISDEMSLLGLYIYYANSGRQLGHAQRIRRIATVI